MKPAEKPFAQAGWLAALTRAGCSEDQLSAVCAGLTGLAADCARAPIAVLALPAGDADRLLASRGLEAGAFASVLCERVAAAEAGLLICDLARDAYFSTHPLVTGPPRLRALAGFTVSLPQGPPGALCVLDTRPRGLSRRARRQLAELARALSARLADWNELQTLRRFHERYETALSNSLVGVWEVSGLDQSETWCSPQLYRMLGFDPEQPPGLADLLACIHQEDLSRAQAILSQTPRAGEPLITTLRLRMASGEYRWCHARGQTISEPSLIRRVGTLFDVEEQTRSARALERFHASQASLHQLSYALDMPRDEFLRQSIDVICAGLELPAGAINRIQGGVFEVLAVNEPKFAALTSEPKSKYPIGNSFIGFIHDQGSIVSLDDFEAYNPERSKLIRSYGIETLIGAPIGVKGEPWGVVTCYGYTARPQGFSDFERDFLDEFCLWLGLMLERRLYIESLQKLNQSKNRLLSVVAHDLRNPLAAIMSAKRRLERGRDQRMLTVIENSGHQALELIAELLEAGELEQVQSKLPLEPVRLGVLVQEILRQFEPRAETAQLLLDFSGADQSLLVALNPRKLARALENLLHNALKFTPAGGEIRLELRAQGNFALLVIQDSGIGIPPHLLEGLFDKYSSARRQGLRGEQSNGLGMFIVKEIIELHGGTIQVESSIAKGTVFEIRLPLLLPVTSRSEAEEA